MEYYISGIILIEALGMYNRWGTGTARVEKRWGWGEGGGLECHFGPLHRRVPFL